MTPKRTTPRSRDSRKTHSRTANFARFWEFWREKNLNAAAFGRGVRPGAREAEESGRPANRHECQRTFAENFIMGCAELA